MRRIFSISAFATLLLLTSHFMQAQPKEVYSWTFEAEKGKGGEYEIIIKANNLDETWHFWTMDPGNEMLIPTRIAFNASDGLHMKGDFEIEGRSVSSNDEIFGAITYYEGDVVFRQKIKSNPGTNVSGSVRFQACNASTCLPPKEIPFTIQLD